ncbi:aspartate aminotransferase family protein [Streptomyces ferrugineus]|uniref:Aspartate aminotransferase family protein n=1 Tax=Streptomyces ferrugineus TaxID=1413221 RepID=A0A7M2SA02_9ACTN|nr:aspartate aminotransferase family protein [Streptomyces ferrugineus]QOV33187.1 aspartate aminotransferase family protein [Streptomyces ferrugineus]
MTTSRLWHGFTDMSTVRHRAPFTITRGQGAYLFDAEGRRYLDASAGLWFCNVGHGRAEIAEAAQRQMSRMAAYSTFGDYTNEPAEQLAARLAELSPTDGASVFFTSGGSDSIDSAIKLVRRFWLALGLPDRRVILSRENAYHGGHIGSTGIGGIALDREGFGELITDTARVAWDSAEDLEKTITSLGAERVAAFVMEPVIAAGGCLFPPQGYLQAVAEICRRHGIVLIADEVVTGFGRSGDWFASRRFGVVPDIIVCAKGLTSGYMPLGALIVGDRIAQPFYDGTAGPFFHGYTYSGHAGAAAVALATMDIIEREALAQNALSLETRLPDLMSPLTDHPMVQEVRTGQGLMAAVELNPQALRVTPGLPMAVVASMREAGVLTRSLVGGQIQFSPPLIIGNSQATEFVDAVLTGLNTIPPQRT